MTGVTRRHSENAYIRQKTVQFDEACDDLEKMLKTGLSVHRHTHTQTGRQK